MNKTKSEITTDVRIAINEVADNESASALVMVDDSEMDTLIGSKIEEAINYVHGNAQISLLAEGTIKRKTIAAASSSVSVNANSGVEAVTMDSENMFIRFVGGKLSSWNGFVSEITEDTDIDKCTVIRAKYAGASYQRPAIIRDSILTFTKLFEFHKTKNKVAEDCTVLYIPSAAKAYSSADGYCVDDNLYSCIVSYCAALVLSTYGEVQRAQELLERAVSGMGIQLSKDVNQ